MTSIILVQLNSEAQFATFLFATMASKEVDLYLEMTSRVGILMSAQAMCTTAILMRSAKTLLAPMNVFVAQDSKEMDRFAMTSMNVRMELTGVTHTPHVQTLTALTNAAAFPGLVEMVKCVEILTKVEMDHMTAVAVRLVRKLWVSIHVRAMTVSMVMIAFALTTTVVAMEVVYVVPVPAVLTSLVLTAGPTEKATLEMEDIVRVSLDNNNSSFIDGNVVIQS